MDVPKVNKIKKSRRILILGPPDSGIPEVLKG
jgi:hypothetical protein